MAAINQSIVYLCQLNLEKIIREMEEEETVRMLNIIMENNTKILELWSILVVLMKMRKRKNKKKNNEGR